MKSPVQSPSWLLKMPKDPQFRWTPCGLRAAQPDEKSTSHSLELSIVALCCAYISSAMIHLSPSEPSTKMVVFGSMRGSVTYTHASE